MASRATTCCAYRPAIFPPARRVAFQMVGTHGEAFNDVETYVAHVLAGGALPEAYRASIDVKHWADMHARSVAGTKPLKEAMASMPGLARQAGGCPCGSPSAGWSIKSAWGSTRARSRRVAAARPRTRSERACYQSLWTNAGVDYDPIVMCVAWQERSGLERASPSFRSRASRAVLALAARTAHTHRRPVRPRCRLGER